MRKVVVLLLLACSIHCAVYLSSRICALEMNNVHQKTRQLQSLSNPQRQKLSLEEVLRLANQVEVYLQRCRHLVDKSILTKQDSIVDRSLPYPEPASCSQCLGEKTEKCQSAKRNAIEDLITYGAAGQLSPESNWIYLANMLIRLFNLNKTASKLYKSCTA